MQRTKDADLLAMSNKFLFRPRVMKEALIHELVGIGRTGLLSSGSNLSIWFPMGTSEAYHIYDILKPAILSDQELVLVFKGLVIAEKMLAWHCGSTSPAAHMYQDIRARHLDSDYSLADWAFQYSDNEYVPFGFIRHGEKTAYEYLDWREEFHNRLAQEQADALLRKEQRKKRAELISQEKSLVDSENKRLRQEIMLLSPENQVSAIIEDKTHNLLFYIPVIQNLLSHSDVPQACWENLLEHLSSLKSTPFNNRLKKAIIGKQNEY